MREEPVEEGKGVEVRRVRLRIRGYGVRELNNVRCSTVTWRSHIPRSASPALSLSIPGIENSYRILYKVFPHRMATSHIILHHM